MISLKQARKIYVNIFFEDLSRILLYFTLVKEKFVCRAVPGVLNTFRAHFICTVTLDSSSTDSPCLHQ